LGALTDYRQRRFVSNYYDRYRRGERIEVWSDLIALGGAVRQEPVYSDALAVARETMTRARENVETLITRLDGIGYDFLTPQRAREGLAAHLEGMQAFAAKQLEALRTNQFTGYESLEALQPGFIKNQFVPAAEQIANSPRMLQLIEWMRAGESVERPTNSLGDVNIYTRTANRDAELEDVERMLGGPLPISLRAWSEGVTQVSFLGSHPVLNPLAVMSFDTIGPALNAGESTGPDPFVFNDVVVAAARDQADPDLWDEDIFLIGIDESHGIRVPDSSADSAFVDRKNGFLVEYLRRVFAWGGFPGWERHPNPPMDLIRELTRGLQPI
jgi:hypothetical protein